eukprot:482799-Prorocentrum_lima.AAC.1
MCIRDSAKNALCHTLSIPHSSVIGRKRPAVRTGASFGSIGTSAPCHTGGRGDTPDHRRAHASRTASTPP